MEVEEKRKSKKNVRGNPTNPQTLPNRPSTFASGNSSSQSSLYSATILARSV
jgi:hypothetical protein